MKLFFSESATLIDPFLPAPLTSKNSILEFWSGLFNAFPDMRHRVDDIVVGEGKAFVAFTTSGIGKGSLGPVNVEGKRVEIEEGYLIQLDDGGLIARLTVFLDTAKLSKQLSA
jgi:predicted ester cyclase